MAGHGDGAAASSPAVGSARPATEPKHAGAEFREKSSLATLALGALGVVYGDIGTSPLYALKECFNGPHGVAPTPANIFGVLSLVFWALTFVVTFKYLVFVMRADNRGEGGILALMALVSQRKSAKAGGRWLMLLGLFGAALLYGDGIITPAISVLGAVEGLEVSPEMGAGTSALRYAVVPITCAILIALFLFQKRGTATVGAVFGPVMLLWFVCIGLVGAIGIAREPSILAALSPLHAARFLTQHRIHGFLVLGAVVLAITGGEALYADMGHFGRRPIRVAWLGVAMPALLLNYFGQGAVLLHVPEAAQNPFYLVLPSWGRYPMIAIATAAAIVASQALISGAFSLTNQAVQLGYSPRVTIRHTSSTEYGQIYIPEVNWAVGAACIALVLAFKSSSALAAAYGIAVTGTMTITTVLFHRVARDLWGWPRFKVWPLVLLFLAVDLSFLGANVIKLEEGGWFPLAAAVFVFTMMTTWKRGREALAKQMRGAGLPLDLFLPELERNPVHRVSGTAVFMTSHPGAVPPVMLHHLKHNKVLHERVLLVSLLNEDIPFVDDAQRPTTRPIGFGIHQVVARYGFMETPNVPALLASLPTSAIPGPRLDQSQMETTYYLGRETLLPNGPAKLPAWRKRLFIVMAKNARSASAFFGLPPNRIVEMGAQIQL
jgi:KUP system potassium uptake protein